VFGTQAVACDESTPALLEGTVMTAPTQPAQPPNQAPAVDREPTEHSWDVPLFSRPRMATHIFGGLARISLGWVFLWAFLDKTFALGFATGRDPETGVVDRFGDAAWINGGSPTEGFLKFAADGPFKGFYNDIAGAAWADWLFMLGLLGIGVALMLGITMRIAAAAGTLLLVMMWTVVLPPENNPFMDDHLIYAMVLIVLALTAAGRTLGFGRFWERLPIVQRYGFLK
jgi:thiosulfate dehydrogenase (quinone) large subunit